MQKTFLFLRILSLYMYHSPVFPTTIRRYRQLADWGCSLDSYRAGYTLVIFHISQVFYECYRLQNTHYILFVFHSNFVFHLKNPLTFSTNADPGAKCELRKMRRKMRNKWLENPSMGNSTNKAKIESIFLFKLKVIFSENFFMEFVVGMYMVVPAENAS